jgi:phospholipid/cholesterol/gamma-HCH transport system permease protein
MADTEGWIREVEAEGRLVVSAGGSWTIASAAALERAVAALGSRKAAAVTFDLSGLSRADTAGMYLLRRAAHRYEQAGSKVAIEGLDAHYRPLFELVAENEGHEPPVPRHVNPVIAAIARTGEAAVDGWREAVALTNFIGLVSITGLRALTRPRRFRPVSLTTQIERTGFDALPIVGLMAFLIGIVLAYQGATQLRRFGAEIFTIDLLALSILREIGVLLTAIMIAGRSG